MNCPKCSSTDIMRDNADILCNTCGHAGPASEVMHSKILTAALAEAEEQGFTTLTRDNVARRAGVSTGLVNRYFGTMDGLRRAVMEEAVRLRLLTIVAAGLYLRLPAAIAAPQELKEAAADSVLTF